MVGKHGGLVAIYMRVIVSQVITLKDTPNSPSSRNSTLTYNLSLLHGGHPIIWCRAGVNGANSDFEARANLSVKVILAMGFSL